MLAFFVEQWADQYRIAKLAAVPTVIQNINEYRPSGPYCFPYAIGNPRFRQVPGQEAAVPPDDLLLAIASQGTEGIVSDLQRVVGPPRVTDHRCYRAHAYALEQL